MSATFEPLRYCPKLVNKIYVYVFMFILPSLDVCQTLSVNFYILIFFSETTGKIETKDGRNLH